MSVAKTDNTLLQPRRRHDTLALSAASPSGIVAAPRYHNSVVDDGADMDDEAHEHGDADVLRADVRRFAVGPIFCLLSAINGMQWIAFSPIVDEVRVYFHMNANQVNFLANTYVIAYVVIVFLSCKLYEVTGIKLGLCVAALTNALGATLKLVTLYAYPNAALLYVAQALNSITEVLTIATPPLITNRWYPVRERAVANTVMSSALNFGCGVGVLLPTFFVGPGRASRGHFAGLFWLHFGLSTLALLLVVFAFPRRPRSHASYAAQRQQGKEEARLRTLRTTLRAPRRRKTTTATATTSAAAAASSTRMGVDDDGSGSTGSRRQQQQRQQSSDGAAAAGHAREGDDSSRYYNNSNSSHDASVVVVAPHEVTHAHEPVAAAAGGANATLLTAAAPSASTEQTVYRQSRTPREDEADDDDAAAATAVVTTATPRAGHDTKGNGSSRMRKAVPLHNRLHEHHDDDDNDDDDDHNDNDSRHHNTMDEDDLYDDDVARVNIFSVLVDCYRECRRNRSLVLLALAAAAELGLIWAVATVLPQMLAPYRVSEAVAGWIGFCNLVLGTVVCPFFMPLVERFGRQYKYILSSIALVLLANLTALTLLLHFGPAVTRDNQVYYVVVTFVCWGGVAGLCQNFMMPLMFEYVVELTFPLAESTSAPLLTWSACLTNLVLALVFGAVLTDTPTEAHALRVFIGATVVTAFGAAALCCTTPLRKRSDYETRRHDERQQLLAAAAVVAATTTTGAPVVGGSSEAAMMGARHDDVVKS